MASLRIWIFGATAFLTLAFASWIPATEFVTEPWSHVGNQIRRSSVEGYQLSYHLLEVQPHTQDIKPGTTHHLMVFILAPSGQMVSTAKVQVEVEGKDGQKQTAVARDMTGGYGADLVLPDAGTFEVSVEIRVRGMRLKDSFEMGLP
jgi:hypothetical protein